MRKSLRFLAVLSVVALLGAACKSDSEPGPSPDEDVTKIPVTVTFQGALSGDYVALVIHAFQAAELRFEELNADESFPATVTLEQGDTLGDPENAPAVVEAVVGNPDSVAVIGPAFSGESAASGDTYEEAGIPFITPSATNPDLSANGWEYWYRAVANDTDQGAPIGKFAGQAGSVFIVQDESEYGLGLAEVVSETLAAEGVEEVGFEGAEAGTQDFSSVISDIESSGAEAVAYLGYVPDTAILTSQMRDAGLDIPVYTGDGSVSSDLLEVGGDSITDVFLSCPCSLSDEFLAQYNEAYPGNPVPVYASEGYDVASMIGEGIVAAVEAGATDAAGIREGIKVNMDTYTTDSPFQGVAKTYAFDSTHELDAEDRAALIFLYEATPDAVTQLGNAVEVLG
ncbi:MAG: branched-chain amino acid ABC transporter substrate-binding protein [Actinomycetota bacterium]